MSEESTKKSALVPRRRFPEFQEAGGWEVTRLKEIASSEASAIALNKLLLRSAGYPVYGADGIVGRVDSFAQEDSYIAIVKDGSGVGRLALLPGKSSVLATLAYVKAHDNAKAKLNWLFYCLSALDLRKYIKGSGIPHIYFSDYSNELIGVPRPTEQQKIADCLSSLDELITAEAQKLDALKIHKKGLMQQLFPLEGGTVPRLRFPEFSHEKGWSEERLEDLAKRGSGHTPNKAFPEYYDGGIKWVSLADSKRLDAGTITETQVKISAEGIANSSAVLHPAGTVLLSRDAAVGKSAVMGESMAVSQHFIVWACKPTQLSNWFLYYSLQQRKPLFERVASGSTIKTIGLPFFIDMRIEVPTLPEQEMIANCLRRLDDLIAAKSQKVDALKTHKKGLMRQLFPVLDEAQP